MEKEDEIRGDGRLPSLHIKARTISEGWHKAMIACLEKGARIETPKHRPGGGLGYDGDINIEITHPLEDLENNVRHKLGIYDDDRGMMQYALEVTHGIHNHWKKNKNNPDRWGYTYNERFVDQLPFVFARIKADWEDKKEKEGEGRITGRDYQFTIWRPEEDIILEQDDPPCWQRGHLRFLKNKEGELVLNYLTDWRSRDESKAWLENVVAQARLQRLFAQKVSSILSVPIQIGSYIDKSTSLHIYGKYVDEDRVEDMIKKMGNSSISDFLVPMFEADESDLKKLIHIQTIAEDNGQGKNLAKDELIKLGYDFNNHKYPNEWDSWPKSWDEEPDRKKLVGLQS